MKSLSILILCDLRNWPFSSSALFAIEAVANVTVAIKAASGQEKLEHNEVDERGVSPCPWKN